MSSLNPTPGAPPQIIRRNDGAAAPPVASPGITETTSTLSSEQGRPLTTVPSHDNSSHSGSEKGAVERLNPFEQQILATNNPSRGPIEPIGSHQSASPERATPPTPSSPQVNQATRSPAMPLMPMEGSHAGPQMPTEEDEFTHSSSAVNSTEPASSYTPSTGSQQQPLAAAPGVTGSLVRFLENTRKRMSSNSRNSSAEELIEDLDGMIISGYLQKLGRNGKWQTRWFESDGECLSYYKNENRTKLLATLDLEKVSCKKGIFG